MRRPNKVSFIDAHDREVLFWRTVVNASVTGSDIRDMRLEAVELRFGACKTQHPIEKPNDNGSCHIAKRTLKRDYVQIATLPEATTLLGLIAGWREDDNDNKTYLGLKMRSPREFIATA